MTGALLAPRDLFEGRRRFRYSEATHRVSVILSGRRALSDALEDGIAELGGDPVVAARPLDAIWYLSDPEWAVGSVFADYALLRNGGAEWFRFLEAAFPRVTRILVSDEPLPHGVSALLASGRVHAVAAVPWQRGDLAELVRGDAYVPTDPIGVEARGRARAL